MNISVVNHIALLPRAWPTVLGGGLIVGVLDGLDAVIFFGLTLGSRPTAIFKYIASGLLGMRAFHAGWLGTVAGIALHFLIALGAAAVYYAACSMLPVLYQKPLLYGPIFGLIVYVVMNHVVVPLSAVPPQRHGFSLLELVNELLAHMLLVGLPIALMAHYSAKSRQDG